VQPSENTNDGPGLVGGAPVEHIPLLSGGDVFEHDRSRGLLLDHDRSLPTALGLDRHTMDSSAQAMLGTDPHCAAYSHRTVWPLVGPLEHAAEPRRGEHTVADRNRHVVSLIDSGRPGRAVGRARVEAMGSNDA